MDTMGEGNDSPTAMEEPAGSAHSPLPWSVFDNITRRHRCPGIEAATDSRGLQFSVIVWGDDEDGNAGVQGHTAGEARANAEFIVRAVNTHDALVDALRRLRNEVSALMAFQAGIREVAGHTNVSVLLRRVSEADAALTSAEKSA